MSSTDKAARYDGLGEFTKRASAILIMAIAGGATIPLLYGYLSGLFR